jgi:hypothetical protein
VLSRIDGGGTHKLLAWLHRRRLSYSVGFSLPGDLHSIRQTLACIPDLRTERPHPGAQPRSPTSTACGSPPFVTNIRRGQLADLERWHRRWEPKRLRLRLLSIPARHACTGRIRFLHQAATAPSTTLALQALEAVAELTAPPPPPTGTG